MSGVADYQSVEQVMDDWDIGILTCHLTQARTHSYWALEHRFHQRPQLRWRLGQAMNKAVCFRKPIIYKVLRLQQQEGLSRAQAIKQVEAMRADAAPAPARGKPAKTLTMFQFSNYLRGTEERAGAFEAATWGWPDDSFKNCPDGNPVKRGRRKPAT